MATHHTCDLCKGHIDQESDKRIWNANSRPALNDLGCIHLMDAELCPSCHAVIDGTIRRLRQAQGGAVL